MPYSGQCQCGAVGFTVDADIPGEAIACNCSICRSKGLLLTFVPASQFTLDKGEDALTRYRFNTHKIEHLFCATCGTQSFARGKGPDGSDSCAINLRCVPEADLDALTLHPYDGASK